MNFYQKTVQAVVQQLETNVTDGLSVAAARERLQKYGGNILPDVKRRNLLTIFLSQFTNPLIYILLIAAAIIFFVGDDKIDAFIISVVLLFNAVIGTIQEGRAENILASLKRFIKTDSVVVRDGQKIVVEDADLVVGDLIVLQEGQRIPADARIIQSNNLQVDESVLTGESVTEHKMTDIIAEEVVLADRTNMLYKGTYVMAGTGRAVVVATGLQTEIGKVHKTVEEIETEIPLKKELRRLSYLILLFILVTCCALFVIGILMGRPLAELLIMLTALFICVVPEGLPMVLTLVLVTGARRMAQQFVLTRNLQAVETLGRTDVIVIDKTGTLTRNEMLVSRIFSDDKRYDVTGEGYHVKGQVLYEQQPLKTVEPSSDLFFMGVAASLLNNAEISYQDTLDLFDIKGDPTEAALFVFSQKIGLNRQELEERYHKLYEIPFDPVSKYHAGFYQHGGRTFLFVIGAPETIMQRSSSVPEAFRHELAQLLDDGLRVVAVGMKEVASDSVPGTEKMELQAQQWQALVEGDLKMLGIFGMQDSIRPEVHDIVHQSRDAGLNIIMATGDHQKTALYVAKKVHIYREGDKAVDGSEFDQLTDEQLLSQLHNTTVYSRVSPHQKMRIIKLFHDQDKIVAMTGDGINDAPSLVAADLGIAMGSIGTEVAKAAADLVLLDDSFVNIVNAIEQGRHIFYTLRKVVLYFFATNMGEILIVLFALFSGLPLPMTAAQILWLNLVTDGFLDAGLSMEPKEEGLLAKSWLERKFQLVDRQLLFKMMFMAIPMGLGSLAVFWYYYQTDIVYARTMTLVTMAMFQWFNAWNCRSERKSLFHLGLFSNKWLVLATLLVLSLQIALLHSSFLQHIFKTVPLSLADWLIVFAVSSSIIVIEELRKAVVTWKNGTPS